MSVGLTNATQQGNSPEVAVNIVPRRNYIDTHCQAHESMRFLSEEQFMVGLANSRVALLIDPTSAFPAESDEIKRTAKRRTLPLDAYEQQTRH